MMRTGWEQFQNCEKLQKSDFHAYWSENQLFFFKKIGGIRFPTLQMLELEWQSTQNPPPSSLSPTNSTLRYFSEN